MSWGDGGSGGRQVIPIAEDVESGTVCMSNNPWPSYWMLLLLVCKCSWMVTLIWPHGCSLATSVYICRKKIWWELQAWIELCKINQFTITWFVQYKCDWLIKKKKKNKRKTTSIFWLHCVFLKTFLNGQFFFFIINDFKGYEENLECQYQGNPLCLQIHS